MIVEVFGTMLLNFIFVTLCGVGRVAKYYIYEIMFVSCDLI